MKLLRSIAVVAASLMLTQGAFAQMQLTPPAANTKAAPKKETP